MPASAGHWPGWSLRRCAARRAMTLRPRSLSPERSAISPSRNVTVSATAGTVWPNSCSSCMSTTRAWSRRPGRRECARGSVRPNKRSTAHPESAGVPGSRSGREGDGRTRAHRASGSRARRARRAMLRVACAAGRSAPSTSALIVSASTTSTAAASAILRLPCHASPSAAPCPRPRLQFGEVSGTEFAIGCPQGLAGLRQLGSAHQRDAERPPQDAGRAVLWLGARQVGSLIGL